MTTGYDASVWNSPLTRLLVTAPNWLGDGIMAMPALQTLRERLHPGAELHVAARPGQSDLWRMHPAVPSVLEAPGHLGGQRELARAVRALGITHAVVLPHSFRSALAPWRAGVPFRRGTVSQTGRGWLINDPVDLSDLDDRHQQWEAARLLLGDPLPDALPPPRLVPPGEARTRAAARLDPLPAPRLALIPGAARGPSKQWPGDRFAAVATAWRAETGGAAVWLGTAADHALCESLRDPRDLNLAGTTSLADFTALLGGVDVVVCNDSGGMHLAATVDTPLAAVFGTTDPGKTGPLSPAAAVLQRSGVRDRRVARDSAAARAALAAVSVPDVLERVLAFPRRSAR